MNLLELKDRIKYYFESPSDLTDTQIIFAVNSARKAAEQRYAFEMNKRVLQVSVDLRTGADWTALKVLNTTKPAYRVRNIKRAYIMSADGLGFTPIDFAYKNLLEFPHPDTTVLVGSEPIAATADIRKLYIVGPTVYFYPFGEAGVVSNVAFDAYIWQPDYKVDFETEDWMLMHGHEYLFWKTLWELNFKKKEWVPRQEGNLQLSADNAEMAFRNMVVWDGTLKGGMTSLNENL